MKRQTLADTDANWWHLHLYMYFTSKYALYILYKCSMNYVPLFKHTANYRGKIAYIICLNPIYLLTLEMKLLRTWRGEGWDAINRFNTGTCLCLSQARTWISNVICNGLFCVQWVMVRFFVLLMLVELLSFTV